MKNLETVSWWLVMVGALNWGLVGFGKWLGGGNWNLVESIFGSWPALVTLVYVLVGLSAVWMLWKKFAS